MSLKTPLNQNLDIKCPKCNHKFVYNLKLDDIKEVNSNKSAKDDDTDLLIKLTNPDNGWK